MLREDYDDIESESSSQYSNDDDRESEVEYPLIDLKSRLSNDLKERRKKDIEKYSNKGQRRSNFKNTEFSREVIGHNKMNQFQMTKTVNYFFSEFDYLREKIKRAQQQTMKQLQEIHCEKRRQMRESYKYHNEELRYDLKRMKEEEKFLAAQAELEDTMRKRERSIARISMERKMLIKEINSKVKEKEKMKDKNSIAKNSEKPTTTEPDNPLLDPIQQSRSRSFLHAGALEVTKDFNNPRTVKRSMEYVEGNEKITPVLPVDNNVVADTTHIVTDNQSALKLNASLEVDNNDKIEETIPTVKDKTAKEIMKDIQKEKKKQLKEILNLPYNIYRRNSKGKLQKVDHPIAKREFKEPSNKDKYKMRKVLSEERDKFQNYIAELAKTTEKIIEEDIKISSQLNAPQLKLKDTVIVPQRTIGPRDWMKVFVSSNIPDDVDPSSTEAIIYCRYIRAPLHKYSHLPNYKLYHTPL